MCEIFKTIIYLTFCYILCKYWVFNAFIINANNLISSLNNLIQLVIIFENCLTSHFIYLYSYKSLHLIFKCETQVIYRNISYICSMVVM